MSEYDITMYSPDDFIDMMQDTSKLLANQQVRNLSVSATAAQQSNALVNNVEFWNWMQRNFSKGGMFDSTQAMQAYLSQGGSKETFLRECLIKGKDYEWSWMTQQRSELSNIFNQYSAGDVSNRVGSDVTQTNIFTGSTEEFQMKAYSSKTAPHLKNTPTDMAVVTNSEKVGQIQGQGYTNVQEFKNAEEVQAASERRIQQIKEGTASPTYTFQNVAGTMAKAGAIGFVIGAGIETMVSYKKWKQGELTDKQYAMEILKAGGNSGITAGATAGIMIPISAAITAAGMSSVITIPIAFVVGSAVDNIVAPCFGRGKYAKILSEAKYYQNLEDMYDGLIDSMEMSAEHYYQFVCNMQKQAQTHSQLKQTSIQMNQNLQKLYDSI